MKSSKHLSSFLFSIIYFLSLIQSQERTNQEQYLATAISEVLGAIEETQVVLQERIKALYNFQGMIKLGYIPPSPFLFT